VAFFCHCEADADSCGNLNPGQFELIRNFMKKNLIFSGIVLMFICNNAFSNSCSSEDEKYLRQILQDTWAYLDRHLAKETGFPTDSQEAGGNTNTTNIGLYLAAIGPAEKMGFISRADALLRINKILDSLAKIESRNGFIYNWIDVGGKTEMPEGVMAVSDFNKLVTGLILIRQFYPELESNASPLIGRVQWSKIYDSATGNIHWGYDLKNDKLIGQGNFWLASDCRSVMFYMIASGSAPVNMWEKAYSNKINVDGLSFYEPGYWFGGLFMQAMDAIFLDSPATIEMGNSIGDFAWSQISQSQDLGLRVWGWSNCNIPGKGYTEGGYLPWWVVTPHASALVIEYYPRHVIKNLRELDSMGLRKPIIANKEYGFRDSIDLKNNKVDDRYLSLDQAMLFLSITNYLEDGMVRKYFAKDKFVQAGFEKLKKQLSEDPKLLDKWAQRDACEPKIVHKEKSTDFTLDLKQPKGIILNTSTAGGAKANARFTPEGLVINFKAGDEETSEINVDLNFQPVNIINLKEIEIQCEGKSKEEFGGIRLYLLDKHGQLKYTFIDNVQPEMKTYNIPYSQILGMLAEPSAVNKINLKLWAKPWFYMSQKTSAKSGRIVIEKIAFKNDGQEK
jgi:hypothetical protein